MRLQPREVTAVVEDEIVSPGLRGVGCYVLTTQAHPEERSGEWRLAGGVANDSFLSSPNPRGLRPWQGCQLQGVGSEPVQRAPFPERTPLALEGYLIS